MKRLAIPLLALLAWTSAAQAQDTQPDWDCKVEIKEDREWWQVDHFSASWLWWSEERAQFRLSAMIYDEHYRHHFVADGPFSQWGANRFVVSPKTTRARGKAWARLDFADGSLEPLEVSQHRSFYGIASFPAHEVLAAMEGSEAVTVTFYDRRSEIIDRYSVPVAAIRAGAERLQSLHSEYLARVANPEEACADRNDVIVFAP